MTDVPAPRPRGLLAGLAVSETVSWGICFYGFAVLLPPMERDLGWSRATLVGAFTIAVIVSGFAAFPVGRWLDRGSARLLMTCGSVARHARRARLVAVPHRRRLLRVVAADRHRHGPRAVRTGAGRADQAVRSPRHVGDHHPHPGRRVRLDDLPTDHRRLAGCPGLARRLTICAVVLGVVTITIHALVLPGRRTTLPTLRRRATVVDRAGRPP